MTTATFNTAGAGSWVVPTDCNEVICRAWGAGSPGSGASGGTGGAFAGHTTVLAVTPGETIYYQVGTASGSRSSWANTLANSVPTHRDHGVFAQGGNPPTGPGLAANCIGDVAYDGGNPSGTTGGGGAGSGGAASGTTGGTPDGGNGGADGVAGTQPGGAGGRSAAGGNGRIQFEYTPVATDTVTPTAFTGPLASLGSPAAYEVPGRAAFMAERIGEPYVALVTITHPSLAETLRFVINTSDIVSRGETFLASHAEFNLPNRGEGRQSAQITIANVDREIGRAVQAMLTPAEILFEIVDAERPDIVVIVYPPMELTNVTANAISVTGDLKGKLDPQDQYPKERATRFIAPAIFR
ncbi:MAG: DUF1833 family protein [Mesorhizobium sp.]